MLYTHIKPGEEIQLSEHFYSYAGRLDVSDLVTLPLDDLAKQEQTSVEKEKEIFGKIESIAAEWIQQAQETARFRQAQQYLKTPPVKHTANSKVKGEYGWYEISNMVYRITWRIQENTRYDRASQQHIPINWEVSWYLTYNTPKQPDNTRSGQQLAGQQQKRFADKASMEKYLQGRLDHYAHLFTEISPPIPKGEEGRFSINGVLLPGYTVETTVDDLLALLDDSDVKEATAKAPPATPKPPAPKQPHHKKKSGPVR